MQELKYQKNCWNNLLFVIMLFLFCVGCKRSQTSYLSLPIEKYWFSPYVTTAIEYKDSIYSIVIEESLIFAYFPQLAEMKYRNLIYPALKDTFQITDTIFEDFKRYDFFVIPIPWIKNLYDERKDEFIDSLVDKEGYFKVYFSSSAEENYLIHLLFHDNIYIKKRQEDGLLYMIDRLQ